MSELYDSIGIGYTNYRQPDPRIQALIDNALGDAGSVLNVGAGAGSYEPVDRPTIAVEPSPVMIEQRPEGLNPVLRAYAESLPFADDSFDASLALLTVHHWPDRICGMQELARVARARVVIFTHELFEDDYWLLEYFPAVQDLTRDMMPSKDELQSVFGDVEEVRVPIPHDCTDGFLAAYWRRPEAYLQQGVRDAISAFSVMDGVDETVERLRHDLESGAWHKRHGHLLEQESMDLGYKLVIAQA